MPAIQNIDVTVHSLDREAEYFEVLTFDIWNDWKLAIYASPSLPDQRLLPSCWSWLFGYD